MTKRKGTSSDPILWAKSILDQVIEKHDPAVKEAEVAEDDSRQEATRLGRSKGGRIRAEKLPAKRRKEIAKKAAQKRWGYD